MSLIVFLTLFGASCLLGYQAAAHPRLLTIKVFSWGAAIFPLSSIFVAHYYRAGVTATDGLLIGFAAYLLLSPDKRIRFKISFLLLLTLSAALIIFIIAMTPNKFGAHPPSLLRDTKVLLYIPAFYLLHRAISSRAASDNERIDPAELIRIIAPAFFVAAIKCITLQQLNHSGVLASFSGISDEFYANDPEMTERYSDFSLPFMFATMLLLATKPFRWIKINTSLWVIFISFIAVSYASGNRTFLIAGLLLIIYIAFRANALIGTLIATTLGAGLSALLFALQEIASRIAALASTDLVFQALTTRYEPFFVWLNSDPGWLGIILGSGLGSAFHIPWFEYREGIDPLSPFIDNFFLTVIYKYGIVGLGLALYALHFALGKKQFSRQGQLITLAALTLCSLTMSIVYQSYFSTILFWLIYASSMVKSQGPGHD